MKGTRRASVFLDRVLFFLSKSWEPFDPVLSPFVLGLSLFSLNLRSYVLHVLPLVRLPPNVLRFQPGATPRHVKKENGTSGRK